MNFNYKKKSFLTKTVIVKKEFIIFKTIVTTYIITTIINQTNTKVLLSLIKDQMIIRINHLK